MDNGDEMTKPSYLFNLLKILCQEKCIIGAKLDMEMFPVMRPVVKKRLYAQSESNGIHERYMYSVLDAREIVAPDEKGVKGKCQLIRLKDPWANSSEWKGACSDFDTAFWDEAIKSAFNSRNSFDEEAAEDTETLNQRFVHEWDNLNDGVFVMRVQDFMRNFNHLTIARPIGPNWFVV